MKFYSCLLSMALAGVAPACQDVKLDAKNIDNDLVLKTTPVSSLPFEGIGPQWGGYDNIQRWTGSATFNEADWAALRERVTFMRPGLIRIMASQGWNYLVDGVYTPEKSEGVLFRILDLCEEQGINVMYGEWGERALVDGRVDTDWLNRSTDFLTYLLDVKGYTCLKYYNMCNEPAGDWSSIGGNYALWQQTYEHIFALMAQKGLDTRITVIAPDVAIWNDTSLADWITRPAAHFGDKIGAYDIHSYPTDDQVKGGSYRSVIQAYQQLVPAGKPMIMGELGFKYNPNSALGAANLARIAADPFAGDDSNMMVYDAFYGVDVADAVIQNMLAGYNGVILWNMDDAMYEDQQDQLKRWGFWNILGEERFGGRADEAVRPWFYPISLLCRYFPVGSTVLQMDVPVKKGLQAVSAVHDGKHTIAIANSHAAEYTIRLKSETAVTLSNAKVYTFTAGEGADFAGGVDANGFAVPGTTETISLDNGQSRTITLPGHTFVLITTMP